MKYKLEVFIESDREPTKEGKSQQIIDLGMAIKHVLFRNSQELRMNNMQLYELNDDWTKA